ncbi:hypothetical protein, variant 2 [Exophiala oligosperma]|uniref:Zn(2)-C6 fungal-type domain-containing protein n=1 Tax=Exophiala oligosperma TaxID=215243 RepID=A0A0D2CBJ7_9EURO|nr:hypothetical protein, variant 2 [Exophiala oligosperma]KIW47277.1 hypothetical protein, variant 2 [Exophiala oligosperma]
MASFITASSDIAPARKYRSRKQKPCDNCRRRRVCCVRDAEGACALCSRSSIPCTFNSKPSPRKRPDRTTTTTRDAIPQAEPDSVPGESPRLTTERGALENPPRSIASTTHSGQKRGVDGKYIGLTGTEDVYFVVDRLQGLGNDPAHEAYFRVWTQPLPKTAKSLNQTDYHLDVQERSASTQSYSSETSNHHASSIEPNFPLARSIFFEQSHPAYPLLDAQLAQSDKQPRLLAIAIAIISKYTSPELAGLDNNVLIEEFTSSLLLEARSPTLETVEAAVLFTQRALRGKMSTTAPGIWAVIGTIVGMSHDLGLNIDCSMWSISAAAKRRRRRIWWAVYMQDKWFALALGRPSYLDDANTTTLMLTAADFEDCSLDSAEDQLRRPELVTGVHCFVAMAELTTILKEVLAAFFTLSSVVRLREATGEHICDIAERIEAKLDNWRATFLDQILIHRTFPDVTGSLEIAFLTVRVMLLRGIFPKLYRRNLPLDVQVNRGVDITSRTITLVETLQINRLSAFWWSYSGFNFTLIGTCMASLKRLSADTIRARYWDERLAYYHAAGEGPKSNDESSVGLFNTFTSPETSWSGFSYDFFPHTLTEHLNDADFSADWTSIGGSNGFQWQ